MTKEIVESKGKIIGGFVCSIVGILCLFLPYIGLPLSILAMWLTSGSKHGLATAGRIVGIVGIVINSVMLFFVFMIVLFALGTGTL